MPVSLPRLLSSRHALPLLCPARGIYTVVSVLAVKCALPGYSKKCPEPDCSHCLDNKHIFSLNARKGDKTLNAG
jgi:hypothetical protein